MPIVKSLLSQDFYKLTMHQAILHQLPHCITKWKFVCRNEGIVWPKNFVERFREEIQHLCSLKYMKEELEYLSSKSFFKKDYIDYLKNFKLDENILDYGMDDCGQFYCYAESSYLNSSPFEIFILQIVNELFFELTYGKDNTDLWKEGEKRLEEKIRFVRNYCHNDFIFSDFGLRRRLSERWHAWVCAKLQRELPDNFKGTSNVDFARRMNLIPIGTVAHEWTMVAQALVRIEDSQKWALQKWADEYRGDLGIALTDTIGIDSFLRDFDLYFAKLYDGVRHDSGDSYAFGEKVINHYEKLKIDPMTKSITFSDGLTIKSFFDIYSRFRNRIKIYGGIGTSLTNDVGVSPLNIVMKIVSCNNRPVAKISDGKGKTMCENQEYVNYLKSVFKIS